MRCTRCERPICPDCMHEAAVGFQCPECVREGQRGQRRPRTAYGGRAAAGGLTVTTGLIGVNVVVFLLTLATSGGGAFTGGTGSSLYDRFAMLPPAIALDHQWYRLLTSMFLHFGIVHIGFNMLALYYLGPELERLFGRTRFLAIYLLAGLGGSAASYALGPTNVLAAGASGAIYGLCGAGLVVARRTRTDAGFYLGYIVFGAVFTLAVPNIDLWAHAGGLVFGALAALPVAYAPRDGRGARQPLVQAIGLAVVLLVVVGVVAVRTSTFLPG